MAHTNRNWPAIIEDIEKSGVSVAEYSRRNGIPYATLISHCRNIRRRTAEELGFVRVIPCDGRDESGSVRGSIRIHSDDMVIELDEGFSRQALVTVFEILDARAGR